MAALAALGLAWPGTAPAKPMDAGPVFTRDVTLTGEDRDRAAGPIYETQQGEPDQDYFAVRPFYSRVSLAGGDRSVRDVLWPLGQRRVVDDASTWRMLLAFGHNADLADDDSQSRWRVFPILFGGRNRSGENYFAVFPIGGKMLESLTCDRITFVLFPLYARTEVNDLTSTHWLWPLVSMADSERTQRRRIFPLYGTSDREGRGRKGFVLWPFWTWAEYTDPRETGSAYVLFPIYGRVITDRQEGWMVLPPLFRYSRSERLNQLHAPWPLIQYSSGDVEKMYFWPLWGQKRMGPVSSAFVAWPFVRWESVRRRDEERRRLHVFPFYHREVTLAAPAATPEPEQPPPAREDETDAAPTGETDAPSRLAHYVKIWPLVSYRREGDHASWRVLALWPQKQAAAVERNLAPLWTLYAHTRAGEAWEEDLLWGLWRRRGDAAGHSQHGLFPLYRFERNPEDAQRSWSVLGGLMAREREGLKRRTRLLYLFTIDHASPAAPTAPATQTPDEE